jgi:hypothetical protein
LNTLVSAFQSYDPSREIHINVILMSPACQADILRKKTFFFCFHLLLKCSPCSI